MIDLDAIKARLDAATPGPWRVSRQNIDERPGTSEVCDLVNDCWVIVEHNDLGRYEDDADLIAHAPADIAALIAEVEAARTEAATMRTWAEEAAKAENENAEDARRERAAVVSWLRECALDPETTGAEMRMFQNLAKTIERGEHRREESE